MRRWIVREREAERDRVLFLAVDNALPVPADSEALARFENAVARCAGQALLLLSRGGEVGFHARGVKVQYLFNLFDFWGTVVTSRPDVKNVKDLEGKQLAAASSTTNFVMFEFFAKKLGMDPAKVQVINTAPPGLVGYALADRADAIQLWEPAYTLLKAKKPEIRALDTSITTTWKSFAGGERIPYLGVAAHSDWIEQNQALIPKLYATYREAGEFIAKNPEEAAALIAPKSTLDTLKSEEPMYAVSDPLGRAMENVIACRE